MYRRTLPGSFVHADLPSTLGNTPEDQGRIRDRDSSALLFIQVSHKPASDRGAMGKPVKDSSQERTVSAASEAEPPLRAVVEGPLSPTRSTNIAESSREPEGRLPAAEELTVSHM